MPKDFIAKKLWKEEYTTKSCNLVSKDKRNAFIISTKHER